MKTSKSNRSTAILLFAVFGITLILCAILLSYVIDIWFIIVILCAGIGLCCAGLVYYVLCRRVEKITGPGISGMVLSIFGALLGLMIIAALAVYFIIFK